MTDGNQCFEIPYAPKLNPKVEMTLERFDVNNNGNYTSYFSAEDDIGHIGFSLNTGNTIYQNNVWFCWVDYIYGYNASYNKFDYTIQDNTKTTLSLSPNTFIVGDKSFTLKHKRTNPNTNNLWILSDYGNPNSCFNRFKLKIYNIKIYENDNLLFNLNPCFFKVYGFYDTVNNKFYRSQGLKDFIYEIS